MDVPGSATLLKQLATMIAGPWATATPPVVHLAAANFAPTPNLNPATLTEATFDGYAASPLGSFSTPHLLSNGTAVADNASALIWTPTGSTTPNTIYGYWMVDHAGVLIQSGLFPTPVLLDGPSTTLQIIVQGGAGPWITTVTVAP